MSAMRTGEVYWAMLEPVRGTEQAGRRPVIVFQNPALSRFTTTVLCIPLTTNTKRLGLPGTCFIRRGEGGLKQDGVALAFQMRALSVDRLDRRIGELSPDSVTALGGAVLDALGLEWRVDAL
jgi:mRNA interferase MazF